MDGDHDVFECLGLPTRPERPNGRPEPSENPPYGTTTDESEDTDVFTALGFEPPARTPKSESDEPVKIRRRWVTFERMWEPAERAAKQLERLEKELREELRGRSQSPLRDEPLNPDDLFWDEPLNPDDPYESDLHGTPHR